MKAMAEPRKVRVFQNYLHLPKLPSNVAGEGRYEAVNDMSMNEKQPAKDGTGGEEQLKEQGDKRSFSDDAAETIILAKNKEAEFEGSREENKHQETSREECAPIIVKEVSTLKKSAKEIELEKFDLGYAEKNLGKAEGAIDGAFLAYNLDANQNLNESNNEMKDVKLVKEGKESNIMLSGFSLPIETNFQAPQDTVVMDCSVNESGDGMRQEEADDSILKSPAMLESTTLGKGVVSSAEQSGLAIEKVEDCSHVATKQLHDAEAVVTTNEETPTICQADSFQQEEAKEERDEVSLYLFSTSSITADFFYFFCSITCNNLSNNEFNVWNLPTVAGFFTCPTRRNACKSSCGNGN